MDKDWQSGNTKRIEKYKIDTWGIRLQNTCLLVWFSVALGSWETLELNFKFDRFIFHKLQELVAKRQISRDPLRRRSGTKCRYLGFPCSTNRSWTRSWSRKTTLAALSTLTTLTRQDPINNFITDVYSWTVMVIFSPSYKCKFFKTKSCEGFTSFELFLSSLEGGLWLSNHLLFQATLKEALQSLENDRAGIQAKIDLLIYIAS